MSKNVNWQREIGRKLRLRDLHVFFTVVHHGSMAKAAKELRISQPSVSTQIADLEHALGVRLFDRHPRGVDLTAYGEALLNRGRSAFDELRQGIRDIEFLANPTAGEVRLGCSENVMPGLLPPIIERLSQKYPRVSIKVAHIITNPPDLRDLHERKLDLVLGPVGKNLPTEYNAEVLIVDSICIAVGKNSPWARRRKIDIAELANELWIMAPDGTPSRACIAAAFQASGVFMPTPYLETYSIHLRNHLTATGRFLAVMPMSVMNFSAGPFDLVALPLELPGGERPVAGITVKGRTLTPVVELFLKCAREVGRSINRRRL